MDRQSLVHRRKGRYMARVLEAFERDVQPHLDPEVAKEFKGTIRQHFHALALDAAEIFSLSPETQFNGAAEDLREELEAHDTDTTRSAA